MSRNTGRTSPPAGIADRPAPRDGGGRLLVVVATVLASLAMLGPGVWAWMDPSSFAAATNWAPHRHFLHDAGAFQIGIGLTLLSSLWWRDAITVVLVGFTVTNTLHAVNHLIDLPLGGRWTDTCALGLVSVVAALGLAARLRLLRRTGSGARPPGGLGGELRP